MLSLLHFAQEFVVKLLQFFMLGSKKNISIKQQGAQ